MIKNSKKQKIKPPHKHTYNAKGEITCCSLEDKINKKVDAKHTLHKRHSAETENEHAHSENQSWKSYTPVIVSFIMLIIGIALDNIIKQKFFSSGIRIVWYAIAYLPVGLPVMKEGWLAMKQKEYFTEFTLMVMATLGAFAIGEYPEGVAVMLFYAIGELFQSAAVNKAKNDIKSLLDVRPSSASVFRDNKFVEIKPEEVEVGEIIQIMVGEKVPLDGVMLSKESSFNTAALTGESKPKSISKGEQILAGMLNLESVVELKVSKIFADSSLAKILDLVQNASASKAKTELLIRRLAKIYTPIVFILAILLVGIPYFFVDNYVFSVWLYRALIFLVISCPCALVISIPLGYFGGIGAASRNGILFKGSNYLELMTKVNTVVMDKTGTLTEGVFKVQEIITQDFDKEDFLKILSAIESKSTHPIAKAISEYGEKVKHTYQVENIKEISGHGLKGTVNGKEVLAGNTNLLKKYKIKYDEEIDRIVETIVVVAIDKKYVGHVLISDEIKKDAKDTIKEMRLNGIKELVMLSGDKNSITQKVARHLGIDVAFGDLLPENKVEKVKQLKRDRAKTIVFVGDGINDAPVLALSDIGIAMGAMGSDAAIETANVVIQTDQPIKIVTAIKIARATKKIVIQNITLAFTVKVIVLALGAGGIATMWEAVFADVGVALLAILNAVRIQSIKF